MQHIGERLPVGADHVIADVGQTDHADECSIEVLLLVDERVTDPGRVVGDRHEVGRGVAVRPQNLWGDLQIVIQRRQARFDFGQVRIQVGEHLADLLAASVHCLRRWRRGSR